MNTPHASTDFLQLEQQGLDLRYASLRIHSQRLQQRLLLSIHEHGLLVPITVVRDPLAERFIVIDGYLRVAVLRTLGQDMVTASVSPMPVEAALIHAYTQNKSRPWDPMEEATLLQELIAHHGYSQQELASRFGKSRAWISRRLQLINCLPGYVTHAIYEGHLSSWNAQRIILPLARAQEEHAQEMVQYLRVHSCSTRALYDFYLHYMRSPLKIRNHMVTHPKLFFESRCESVENRDPQKILPEMLFEKKLEATRELLQGLQPLLSSVFYHQQPIEDRDFLMSAWRDTTSLFDTLHTTIERLNDDCTSNKRSIVCLKSTGGE